MASFFGAFGVAPNPAILSHIRAAQAGHGLIGGQVETIRLPAGTAMLGLWQDAALPLGAFVDRLVYLGPLSPDAVRARAAAMGRGSALALRPSLASFGGPLAVAVAGPDRLYLAATSIPLWLWTPDDEDAQTTYFSSAPDGLALVAGGSAPQRLPAYTILDLLSADTVPLPRRREKRAIVLASGGIQSAAAAAQLRHEGHAVLLLHTRYGQPAQDSQLSAVSHLAPLLQGDFDSLDLDYAALRPAASGQPRTPLPDPPPLRTILLAGLAAAYAANTNYHQIVLGASLDGAFDRPETHASVTDALATLLPHAAPHGYALEARMPLAHLARVEQLALATRLGIDPAHTWSCDLPADAHGRACGTCASCQVRLATFAAAGRPDPCRYREASP